MHFSTPIRRVPATTAPLTTLITISTDIPSPISPNAAMTAAMSVFTAAVVAALEKSYSICDTSGAPAACSAPISPGVTQPCAVPVADVAMPTTVSFGEPGTPVTVTCDPIPSGRPDWLDNTICPGP